MRKQLKLFSHTSNDCFGGSLLKGNARFARPLDTKLPIHLVLRANVQNGLSMRNPRAFRLVNETVENAARKYGVRIYEYANVGNHLHMLLRISNRHLWARFIREVTGRIARLVKRLRVRQGNLPLENLSERSKNFWLFKPFTRVVKGWRKAFTAVREYVILNQMEGDGTISRSDWKSLKQMREAFMASWGWFPDAP